MGNGADPDNVASGDTDEEKAEKEQAGSYADGEEEKVSMQRLTAPVEKHQARDQPGSRGDEEQRPAGDGGLQGIEHGHTEKTGSAVLLIFEI
jgi:hypothetical protein